tara:strand:- start:177 stop:638 length:462 start_codon:yes stop_codon:yes gene_type:complete
MFYYAYGANLNMDNMRYRCPNAQALCPMELSDYRLCFRGVADIEPCKGDVVHGALWKITKQCEKALDVFEGYPHLYSKRYFDVKFGGDLKRDFGEHNRVMVYVMNRKGYSYPSDAYVQTIAQGYEDFALPVRSLIDTVQSTPSYSIYESKQWG